MGDWFDDIDTGMDDSLAMDTTPDSSTADEDYDPFNVKPAENSTTESTADTVATSGGFISRMRDTLGPAKFGALIAIIIGTIAIVVVALIFGKTSGTPQKPDKQAEETTSVQQTTTTQQSTSQTTVQPQQQQTTTVTQIATTGNSWNKISSIDIDTTNAQIVLEDTFNIVSVSIYADVTNGYALRAEACGTLSGRGGSKTYTTTISVDAALKLSTYLQTHETAPMTVSYKLVEKNSTLFVYDIELK